MNELLKQIKLTEVEGFTPGTPCAKVSLSDRCPERAYCVKKKIRTISDREYYARLFYKKYIEPEGAISLNEILNRPFFSVYENVYSGDEYCLYREENGMWYEAETVDTEFVDDLKLAESVRLEILKMMEEYRDEIEEFKDGEGYQYCETSSDRYDYVTSNYGKIGEYCADNDRLTRAFGLDQEWEI